MLCFACGSNLNPGRLHHRGIVPGAARPGRRVGFERRFAKEGTDGSAKATLRAGEASAAVHGVIFKVDGSGHRRFRRYEGYPRHYHERTVVVEHDESLLEELLPYDWHLGHMLAGARHFRLPAEWIGRLEATPVRVAADARRASTEWKQVPERAGR